MTIESINIPPNLPLYIRKSIPTAVQNALEYLRTRYDYNFHDIHIVFQKNAIRSRYFNNKNGHRVYGTTPTATISCRQELLLYDKKSLGKYRLETNVGYEVQIGCAIVHELTHHVQFLEKRGYGELETTSNELDYLKSYYKDWYEFIFKQTTL